jgi:hypothetical protein
MSAPLLTTAVSLLNVFLLGLEILSEQTFWVEKLIFGNFLTRGTVRSFSGLIIVGRLGIIIVEYVN